MTDLPAARIEHAIAGRLRLRITARRRDAAYFTKLSDILARLPGIKEVAATPETGSVVIRHDSDLRTISNYGRTHGIFIVANGEKKHAARAAVPVDSHPALERLVMRVASDPETWRVVAGSGLAGLALLQLVRGNILGPALTIAFQAISVMGWSFRR